MHEISRNIKALRTEKGWTQEQFAQALFVTRQTVSNYENGRSKPDLDMLTRMAQVFEVDVNVLLCGLPDQEERHRKLRQLAVCFGCCLLLLALSRVLHHAAYPLLHKYYIAAPTLLLNLTLDQWFFLGVGWTLMFAVTLLWNQGPHLPQRICRWGRRLLIALFIIWVLLLLPTILSLICACISYVTEETIQFSLHWPPAYHSLINIILLIQLRVYWLNIPFGALLCLFGIPPLGAKHEKTDPSA